MPLFEFDLLAVEDIKPWDDVGLSWFVLTDGFFRIPVGNEVLFRHSGGQDASYYLAALARDVLGCVGPGIAPLSEMVARLASNWDLLEQLMKQPGVDDDLYYTAWRWLGARSPWASYFTPHPDFRFVRLGDEIHIHWDNREHVIDGVPVWMAQHGVHALSLDAFLAESKDFAERFLSAMNERIDGLEAGTLRPKVPVNIPALRKQHETWRSEYTSYFRESEPDMPWDETEAALRTIADMRGIRL